MTINRLFFVILLMALVSNCEKKNLKQEEAEVEKNNQKNSVALTNDIEKGRTVYFANCVSCHNNNPKKPGSIGPVVYGVPIDVLTEKIVLLLKEKPFPVCSIALTDIQKVLTALNRKQKNMSLHLIPFKASRKFKLCEKNPGVIYGF